MNLTRTTHAGASRRLGDNGDRMQAISACLTWAVTLAAAAKKMRTILSTNNQDSVNENGTITGGLLTVLLRLLTRLTFPDTRLLVAQVDILSAMYTFKRL